MVGGRAQDHKKKLHIANTNKKQNLFESDTQNEGTEFARFIVWESLEEICFTKSSPFLREKIIFNRANTWIVKKIRNDNLHVEVNYKR